MVVNGSDLSPLNVAGVIICLLGISGHVYRKATDPESSLGNNRREMNRQGSRRGGGERHSEYSLPLLSDDSDDSTDEDELFYPGGRPRMPRSASSPGDNRLGF